MPLAYRAQLARGPRVTLAQRGCGGRSDRLFDLQADMDRLHMVKVIQRPGRGAFCGYSRRLAPLGCTDRNPANAAIRAIRHASCRSIKFLVSTPQAPCASRTPRTPAYLSIACDNSVPLSKTSVDTGSGKTIAPDRP